MPILIVVNNPANWPLSIRGVEVVAARQYLSDPSYHRMTNTRVVNLCRSYSYQSLGYYVSLLAEARAQKPEPDVSTIQNMAVAIDVAVNDSDPNGNLDPALTNTNCATCSNPVNGKLANYGAGNFDYRPNVNFIGSDAFVYEICDTSNLCDTATVNITVHPIPDPPSINTFDDELYLPLLKRRP